MTKAHQFRAVRIVRAILEDLTDRNGLDDAWCACDKEIQQEIKESWLTIVERELNRETKPTTEGDEWE